MVKQTFVGEPAVDAYIVSFLAPATTEDVAKEVIEECGATLARWMCAIHMAVVYVSCDSKKEILSKLQSHEKTNNVYEMFTRV